MILFSLEVKKFKGWIKANEIPDDIYDYLHNIHFNYFTVRKDISDSLFLFLKFSAYLAAATQQNKEDEFFFFRKI